MNKKVTKAVVAASAALASLGALRMSFGQTLIQNNGSAIVDGWNITAPTGVSLTVTTSNGEIFIEKAANFTVPGQGFQVAFQPVSGATNAATSIDFTDETIQNNTGKAFSGFDFILMNIGNPNATFDGVGNVFVPPTGTGYAYTTVSLNGTHDILSYTGNQNAGTTSSWGSAADGDNLLIDAPSGSAFSLKELSIPGGGGAVPLPAAAWQSMAGLAALGLIGLGRKMKRSMA
jgi:hypothetical protein